MIAKATKKTNSKKPKLCLVCSAGGHFYELNQLSSWWNKHERFWVTFDKPDTKEPLEKERVYFGFFPENRNLINAARNLILAMRVLSKEKPDVIFSTGAGIAPPFFLVGKLMGINLIYLEGAGHLGIPTLTGKMVHFFVDTFLVQHKSSLEFFSRAEYKGGLI